MADFMQALRWMKEGKKVARLNWVEDSYVLEERGNIVGSDGASATVLTYIGNLTAEDWVLYEIGVIPPAPTKYAYYADSQIKTYHDAFKFAEKILRETECAN